MLILIRFFRRLFRRSPRASQCNGAGLSPEAREVWKRLEAGEIAGVSEYPRS